jgi:hypothetical protein
MQLKYNAISYVMNNGKPHHKMKVLIILNKKDEARKLLKDLKKSQNSDGGWAWLGWWPFDEPRPSSTYDTAYILDLFLGAGEKSTSECIKKAVNFLFSTQHPDGGWSESPKISKAIKKEWVWYSTQYSITWITARIISVLIDAGYRSDPRIHKALGYLRGMQNKEGGWPSHEEAPQRTDLWTMEDIIEAFVKMGEQKNSSTIKNALDAIVKHRERWKDPSENPLGIFVILGYELKHPYVQECLDQLVENQHADGGWGFYNNWPSNPDTVSAFIPHLLILGIELERHD